VRESFASDFKRFFLRGLAAFLPAVVTLMIIIYVITFIQKYLGRYINIGVVWIIRWAWEPSLTSNIETIYNRYFTWVGFLLALVGIYFFGRFIGSFMGRSFWRIIEQAFLRLPIVKAIYPYVKQVTDFALSERKLEFSRVVAVEYPRKGIWSLGLVTGPGMRRIGEVAPGDLLTLFIPSSPTPFTGYTITVRRDEVIDLPISIDEAIRYTVSGGVIMPIGQKLSEEQIQRALHGVYPKAPDKEITA